MKTKRMQNGAAPPCPRKNSSIVRLQLRNKDPWREFGFSPLLEPIPIDANDNAGPPAAMPSQLVGNGYGEWTSTVFAPFPGFHSRSRSASKLLLSRFFRRPALRSERRLSPRTAARLARPSFRNWFRHLRIRSHIRHIPAGSFVMYARAVDSAFARDVRAGLMRTGQKTLPCRYFYDELGSSLFEAITQLPEYGLTRADERILGKNRRLRSSTVCRVI